MPDFKIDNDMLHLIEAIIDGRITAVAAGAGTAPTMQSLFGIAEKLGQLSRAKTVRFDPHQVELLLDSIDCTIELIHYERRARTPFERIAGRLTDLAFSLDDPTAWVFNLHEARNSETSLIAEPGLAAAAN